MAFTFQPKMKKRSEYGGVADYLRDETSQFTRARRQHGLRSMMGLEKDEPEGPEERMAHGSEEAGEYGEEGMDASTCPDCAAGTCDNPEHMSESDKDAMAGLVIAITPKKGSAKP